MTLLLFALAAWMLAQLLVAALCVSAQRGDLGRDAAGRRVDASATPMPAGPTPGL